METNDIDRQSLAFVGLASEYCAAIEAAAQTEKEEFVASMLRLLPRIYITASDLQLPPALEEYEPLDPFLDADHYEQIRAGVALVMGQDDTFLETFEEDMKYSDTPIAATVSESLADLYQPLINCAVAVRDSEGALTLQAVAECREEFAAYWAQTLVNVLRPLNALYYNQ